MVKPEKGRALNSAKILYPEGGPVIPQRNKNAEPIRYNGMLFAGNRICFTLLHIYGANISVFLIKQIKKVFFLNFFYEVSYLFLILIKGNVFSVNRLSLNFAFINIRNKGLLLHWRTNISFFFITGRQLYGSRCEVLIRN